MRLFYLFFISLPLAGLAQNIETITKAAAQEDLQFLKESIKTYQPALDVYNDIMAFEQLSDSLSQSIAGDLDIFEFHKLICRLIAAANEGHFGLGTNEDAFRKGFFDNSFNYLPLTLYYSPDGVMVEANKSGNPAIKKGDEIFSINGRSMADIKREIAKYVFVDGNIESYLEIQINRQFPFFYFWFVERPDVFEIEYRSGQDDTRKSLTISAMNSTEIKAEGAKIPKNEPSKKDPSIADFYTLEILENRAVLKLKSFDWKLVEKYELEPAAFYEAIFTKLKNQQIEHLIVDLRFNTGGRVGFAQEIIPFILKEEKKGVFRESISWKGKKKTKKLPKKHQLAFAGDIYLLINGKTFSSAASLAAYLKEFGNAIVIGEESGSRYEGYVAGSSETVYLPNTNIKIYIPRYWTNFPMFNKQQTSNRGLFPDYPIDYSWEAIQSSDDLEMQLALKLIQEE